MKIQRNLQNVLKEAAQTMPIISLMGPRQSGKTTLSKMTFSDYTYLSFEDVDIRRFAEQDPRGFLRRYNKHVILDEIQRVPDLFSYLQGVVDEDNIPGQYILTGSQNFLLLENITQSLAGRVALFTLLPLSIQELKQAPFKVNLNLHETLHKGFYPRLYERDLPPHRWYTDYLTTYVERDVRQIINVTDLSTFQNFLRLCAGRCGQLINYADLANDAGIAQSTAKEWLSLLEASFIIYFLRPHHSNFNKRLIKAPKLYFHDPGLVCALLGITEADQIQNHYLRGGLFESMVISELMKARFNAGLPNNLYYWRDKTGHEVDCIQEFADSLHAIEIKSSQTFQSQFIETLLYYQKLSKTDDLTCIYGGDQQYNFKGVELLPWTEIN